MSGILSRRVIIVEPRKILSLSLEGLFHNLKHEGHESGFRYGHNPAWLVRTADSVESAMQCGFEPMEANVDNSESANPIFLLGGNSYWKMIDAGKRLQACFPNTQFILLDDRPLLGCALVADQLSVQGYVSLRDNTEHLFECVHCVVGNGLYISPQGKDFLESNMESNHKTAKKTSAKPRRARFELWSHTELRTQVPFTFSERELRCFQLLLTDMECNAIVQEFGMQCRSARNLKYRIMRRMGIKHFVDLLRLAHGWGLLDS